MAILNTVMSFLKRLAHYPLRHWATISPKYKPVFYAFQGYCAASVSYILRTGPLKSCISLTFKDRVLYYTPTWYHNFEALGLKTYQYCDQGYKEAQQIKEYKIIEYIDEAMSRMKKESVSDQRVSAVELFCADGFYANYIAGKGGAKVVGIDLQGESGEAVERKSVLDQARLITKLLGHNDCVSFVHDNVFNLRDQFDIVLCIGGLYHLEDPEKLLRLLFEKTNKFLIIQTVVTLETEDVDYFVSPCPGWTWGSRFTHQWLVYTLANIGWDILSEYRNELSYNAMLRDRGSSYILCSPTGNAKQQGK